MFVYRVDCGPFARAPERGVQDCGRRVCVALSSRRHDHRTTAVLLTAESSVRPAMLAAVNAVNSLPRSGKPRLPAGPVWRGHRDPHAGGCDDRGERPAWHAGVAVRPLVQHADGKRAGGGCCGRMDRRRGGEGGVIFRMNATRDDCGPAVEGS